MLEVHIPHFMKALTGEKTKAPRRGLYVKHQKVWPIVKNEINKMEELVKFTKETLQVGSPLYELASKALHLGKGLDLGRHFLGVTIRSFESCLFST
jgi:hypothetical protein